MENENKTISKYPKLKGCKMWGEGMCEEIGCIAQDLMNGTAQLNTKDAEEARRMILADAKKNHCKCRPLKSPKS